MHQPNALASGISTPGALAEQFQRRWLAEDEPSLDEFLATSTAASASEVCGVLRVDLRERWRRGTRISAEIYLSRFSQVADDPEAACDLIFIEFMVREDLGEAPTDVEYLTKYPRYAELIDAQIQFHHMVNEVGMLSLSSELLPRGQHDSLSAASPHNSPLQPPETIGRYRIVRLLGSGGMGSVWLARDVALDRDVALKLPRLPKSCGAKVIERFYREARAAAKLSHPNLCVIHDVGDENGIPYLAMQYLVGETLDTVLRREAPLAPQRAVDLALQIGNGLEAVHRGGVVHRDLKPANVIFNERGVPIVTDFGLAFLQSAAREEWSDGGSGNGGSLCAAQETAADHRLTIAGQLLGTPAYAAPEQLLGNIHGLSAACDVYSLGVVLFEMLTGRVPFAGNLSEVTRRAHNEIAPPPSELNRDVPAVLDTICRLALEKEPSARFASMTAFRIALEEAARALQPDAAREIVVSPAIQLTEPPQDQFQSQGRLVPNRRHFLAAGCLTALTGGAGYFALRSHSETSINHFQSLSSDSALATSATFASTTQLVLDDNAPTLNIVRRHGWPDRHAYLTGFSPDGAYYWCGGEYYLGEQVRVWEGKTGREVIAVRGTYLRFSPDCQMICSAVRNPTPKIERWILATGTRLPALVVESLAIDLGITPDGNTLISTHQESLTTWNLQSRQPIWKCPLKGMISARISAINGNLVIVYDVGKTGSVAVVDLKQQRIVGHFFDPHASPSRLLNWAPATSEVAIINSSGISTWEIDPPKPIRNLQFSADGNRITANAISRDGRWVLVATELSPRVYLVNLTTGKTHGVASIGAQEILIGYHDISPDGRFAVCCRPAPSEVFVLEMPPEVWQDFAARPKRNRQG